MQIAPTAVLLDAKQWCLHHAFATLQSPVINAFKVFPPTDVFSNAEVAAKAEVYPINTLLYPANAPPAASTPYNYAL